MWIITLVRIILLGLAISFFCFLLLVGLIIAAAQQPPVAEEQAAPLMEFEYMPQQEQGTRRSKHDKKFD